MKSPQLPPEDMQRRLNDRYEIESELGHGGMGAVFAGRDALLNRPVAIKLLPAERREHARAAERMSREARAMARIAHPGVVQVFDHGVDARLGAYIVMERLFGENLAQFLHERGPLDPGLALHFIEQMCAAVQAAHSAGVIHRDLKPSNVFVMRSPTMLTPRIKVMDFGVAKLDEPAQLTEPGDVLGTLAYLPPERWESGPPTDERGDVYALGAIAYEMLSGSPPFRAVTRAALRLAVLHDEVRSLHVTRPELPPAFAVAIGRALSKDPGDRFSSAWEFALALGIPLQRPEADPSAQAAAPFGGTSRFRLLRSLGRGQGTEVHAAWDIARERPVALKRLLIPSGESLLRLKREFRALCNVHHRNVVRAHELIEEGEHTVLVLELVDGVPLLDYLASSPADLNGCLHQLTEALAAIHAAGLVHGDLTPQNVLVEPKGRVVLLDCGLSWRARSDITPRGTVGYLAPELLDGQAGPEADFYALGVVLSQAITGEVPVPGVHADGLLAWLRLHARNDRHEDFSELCARLLDPNPRSRASRADVLVELGVERDLSGAGLSPRAAPLFVGRVGVLADLSREFHRAVNGDCSVFWLQGASGMGKTSVLEHFSRNLEGEGRALVLRARARHPGVIPFPAFDELIAGLTEWLLRQASDSVAALLPRETEQLARLFPELLAVPAIARNIPHPTLVADSSLTRLQATHALRELIRRICSRHPVVLSIDDVQWLDDDSTELLAAVLRAPDPPPLMVLGAVRIDGQDVSSPIRKLENRLRETPRKVLLESLTEQESLELLRSRWSGTAPLREDLALRLARQSGGLPYFVDLLADGLTESDDEATSALNSALKARHQRLPELPRLALELVCVASRPLKREILAAAVGSDDPHWLIVLFVGCLVRSTHASGGEAIEPYHARVRDAVLLVLSPERSRRHHEMLARALSQSRDPDPESLVEHLAGSGQVGEAATLALAAAEAASVQLAFGRAAALFRVALRHGRLSALETVAVQRRRARALQDAGRRREAGQALLEAAEVAPTPEEAKALRRDGGSHLLLSGDTQPGLEALAQAIELAGLVLPVTPADTVAATIGALQTLAVRGMSVGAPQREPALELERIDLCLLLAQGLAHIDLRALPFAILALHGALDVGERGRLQRAAAVFVVSTAGHLPNPLTQPALELCRQLTDELGAPYSRALLHAAEAEMALSQGRFLASEANFERAERALLESCSGATRELAVVRDMAVFIQYAHKGDFHTQLARTQRWMREAEETQDRFHLCMLRVAHAIVWIAQDDPARASEELDKAVAELPIAGGILSVVAVLYRDIVDRYVGAERSDDEQRLLVLASPAAQTPFLAGYVALDRIWRAIRVISRAGLTSGDQARIARDTLAALRALNLDIWLGVADALEANLDYLRGARESALQRLDEAEQTFRRLHMLCLAACARKRRGQFIGTELGARLELEADTELRQLGVLEIEHWSRAYWSVFSVGSGDLATNVNGQTADLFA